MTEKGKLTSFAEYISRAKDGQKEIYFQIAPSREAIESGPYLEGFKARGLEVIYFYEPIDEYVISSLPEFEGKKLQAVNSPEVDLGDVAQEGESLSEEEITAFTGWLNEALAEGVEEVRASKRLTESASCLVVDEYDMAPHLKRMLKAAGQDMPDTAPALEVNPQHALVQRAANESDEDLAREFATLLLEQAQLLEGAALDDPAAFVKRMNALIAK